MSRAGSVEVICGGMFSGKTEELQRRVRRALYARLQVQAFKPVIDDRYADEAIVSHGKVRIDAKAVPNAEDIPGLVNEETAVVAIDEAQFLDPGVVEVCDRLASEGRRVIVAGLDMDSNGTPFGPIPNLMAVAERVDKLLAVCVVCGEPASRSQRLVKYDEQVRIGGEDAYEARCRRCHEP